jgi:hypothetical protein
MTRRPHQACRYRHQQDQADDAQRHMDRQVIPLRRQHLAANEHQHHGTLQLRVGIADAVPRTMAYTNPDPERAR